MFPYLAVKSVLDFLLGLLASVLFSPVLLLIGILVRVKLGSPVFFSQDRPGLGGRVFEMYKFRTMTTGCTADGRLLPDEQRMTPFGRFLRRTSLDELPGIINVLKGDMSLVGPRPLLVAYLGRYSTRQARRHEVKPGITGWAQVNGRNAVTWEEKFEMDVWYVDNRSLALDFQILFMTVMKVLKKDGVSAAGHETMPEFLGSPSHRGKSNSSSEGGASS